jgi:hypothetical protein
MKCPAIKRDGEPCGNWGSDKYGGMCAYHSGWSKRGGNVSEGFKDNSPTVDPKPSLTVRITTSSGKIIPIQDIIGAVSRYGDVSITGSRQGYLSISIDDMKKERYS